MRIEHRALIGARTVADLHANLRQLLDEGCPPEAMVKRVIAEKMRPPTPPQIEVVWSSPSPPPTGPRK